MFFCFNSLGTYFKFTLLTNGVLPIGLIVHLRLMGLGKKIKILSGSYAGIGAPLVALMPGCTEN